MADIEEKRISDLPRATEVSSDTLFETAIPDSASETGYSSKSAGLEDIAEAMLSAISFETQLITPSKTVFDAINDAYNRGGGGGSSIDDDNISTKTTYSSAKIESELLRLTADTDNILDLNRYTVSGDIKVIELDSGIRIFNNLDSQQSARYAVIEDVTQHIGSTVYASANVVNNGASNIYLRMYLNGTQVATTTIPADSSKKADINYTIPNGANGELQVFCYCAKQSSAEYTELIASFSKMDYIPHRVPADYVARRDLLEVNENVAEIKDSLIQTESRVDVLEKMSKGILYDFVSQTVDGVQSVPKGAHMASVQNLEGKSVAWNQLIPIIGTSVHAGVTITSNGDGSYTLSGTASSTVYCMFPTKTAINHVYYLKGCPKGGSSSKYSLYNDGGNLSDYGDGTIASATKNNNIYIRIQVGEVTDGLVFKPQLFDLTQMFGAGNEPTAEQFEKMFSEDYYPYNIGELKSVNNTVLTNKGRNIVNIEDFELVNELFKTITLSSVLPKGTYTISADIESSYNELIVALRDSNRGAINRIGLTKKSNGRYSGTVTIDKGCYYLFAYYSSSTSGTGNAKYKNFQIEKGSVETPYAPYHEPIELPLIFQGKSAGTVHDELDFVNKKYIQRVGEYVINPNESMGIYVGSGFSRIAINAPNDDARFAKNARYLTAKFTEATPSTDTPWTISNANSSSINRMWFFFPDSVVDSVEKARQWFTDNPTTVYFQLAEPIITDISAVLDSFEVEGNGSIEFDTPIPLTSTIEFLRYLNEV